MPTAGDLSTLINLVAPQIGLEEDRYWQWGTTPLPRDAYHRAVWYVYGEYTLEEAATMPEMFEKAAKDAGFRLLKVQLMGVDPYLGALPGYLFSGYAASDVIEQTVGDLSKALFDNPTVIDSQQVGVAEKAALDALWIAQGAKLPKVEHEINVTGVALGVVAILGVSTILWLTVRRRG